MRLELGIALEDDTKMIFQNEGTGRRIVVGTYDVWVPQLKLTSDGQKVVNDHESFLKATQWSYLKKSVTPQLKPKRGVRSSWLITPSVKNTFLFLSANPKENSLEENPSSSTPSILLETTRRNCPHAACSMDIVTLLSWIMTADSNCESSTIDKLTQKITTTQAPSCKSPTSRQFTVSFTFTSQEFDSALSAE